jgi:hypothetical protein
MMLMADPQVIIKNHQRTNPVDVIAIARELGIKTYTSEFKGTSISGMLKQDTKLGGPSGYAIFVNGSDPKVRQRFTIAHELAHFILHRDRIGSGITDDKFFRSGLSSREEAEANRLAADILMPYDLIDRLMTRGIKEIDALADALKVSKSAIKIRLGVPVTD